MKTLLLITFASTLIHGTVVAQEITGIVQPIREVTVSSPVLQEVITEVLVEEGDAVTEGQVIVKLRSDREELEVKRTEKLMEISRFKSQGHEALLKDKMVSREKALEERAQLELAEILHDAAEVALKEKTVRAPLAGIVVAKHKEPGESVDRVEKLVDIVNIDQVYVQFMVDAKLMQSLRLDQEVAVRFPVMGNAEFKGKISFIDPRVEATTGNSFRVKVLIDNPDHKIKAGMRGVATFAPEKRASS